MAMRVLCKCGRTLTLPAEAAGRRGRCPACRTVMAVPTVEEDRGLMRWYCACGQRLKAREASAGRNIACPNCGQPCTVPKAAPGPPPAAPPAGEGDDVFAQQTFMLDNASGIFEPVRPCPTCRQRVPLDQEKCPACGASVPALAEDYAAAAKAAEPEDKDLELIAKDEDLDSDLSDAAMPPHCPRCGAAAQAGTKRCAKCGSTLRRTPPTKPSAAPPAATPAVEEPEKVKDLLSAEEDISSAYELAVDTAAPPALTHAAVTPEPKSGLPAEDSDFADDGEGLSAQNLERYFNITGGVEAARAGALQVLNGLWLYVPYTGIVAALGSLHVLAVTQWARNPTERVLLSVLVGMVSLFALVGFTGCIKDGVFQRGMGLERLAYHGVTRLVPYALALLLQAPLVVGAVLGLSAGLAAAIASPVPFLGKAALVVALGVAAVGVFAILMLAPVLTVLERRGPIRALGHAVRFGQRHFFKLVAMSIALVFIGTGTTGIVYVAGRLVWPLLLGLPGPLLRLLSDALGSLVSSALMGQFLASIMLLYLSHVGDEEELQRIRRTCSGPRVRPWVYWAGVGLIWLAALMLAFQRPIAGQWIGGATGLPAAAEQADGL
jgi:hypothetical protein